MFKNYFFLNRFITEANLILKDFTVSSIFSQDKDKLIIELNKDDRFNFLEISVNPGNTFITLRDKYSRAKKNTIDFFNDCLHSKLTSIEILQFDRIIRLVLDSSENSPKDKNIHGIYFSIRGKYSNVFLIDNNKIELFKNMPEDFNEENLIQEIKSGNFSSEFIIPELRLIDTESFAVQLKNKYPFIGKEILMEANFRNKCGELQKGQANEIILLINNIINEIKSSKPVVFYDDKMNKINIGFESFHIFEGHERKIFDNLISAMNYYLYKRYIIVQIEILNQRIRKHIEKELKKVTDKLNNLKKVIDRGSKEEEYKKFGNLLLINLSLIQPRMDFVEVRDIYSGNQIIKIKLDTSLPYKKNADNYFEKAKNEKTRLEKANELFNIASSKFNKLKLIEEKLSAASALEDYFILMKELKIKDNSSSNEEENLSSKFKHYVILEKYNVYVGKDSKNNDLLTMKFAKQNDFWFHARKVPGSHVVLRVENKKEVMPKNILTKAASLAAFHSKAKTSGLAPVSYTQKKYVIKKKGMDPGEVALLKEDVLIVKPEIPQGCEYISNE